VLALIEGSSATAMSVRSLGVATQLLSWGNLSVISEFKEFLKAERIPSEFASDVECLSSMSVG